MLSYRNYYDFKTICNSTALIIYEVDVVFDIARITYTVCLLRPLLQRIIHRFTNTKPLKLDD